MRVTEGGGVAGEASRPVGPRLVSSEPQLRTRTIRVQNLELAVGEDEAALRRRACAVLGVGEGEVHGFRIARKALDARRVGGRPRLRFVVHVDLMLHEGAATRGVAQALRTGRAREVAPPASLIVANVPARLRRASGFRVVVVGAGPAGLFAALVLARNGIAVTLLDRGPEITRRSRAVVAFHRTRQLDPEANLLFGEGGAGTYSDGKIYTRIDDPLEVPLLEELVACGAPPEIVYDSLAHIGTDRLHRVLPRLRCVLLELGVEIHFETRLERLVLAGGVDAPGPRRVRALGTNHGEIACDALVLAVGHSARDTWAMLAQAGVAFEPKPFQLGLRIEHPQSLIDRGRLGDSLAARSLGAASYGLVARARPGIAAAHTFCMCPGGRMVAAVNEPGRLCVNGMSNSRHSSPWATSAIVATLHPETFPALLAELGTHAAHAVLPGAAPGVAVAATEDDALALLGRLPGRAAFAGVRLQALLEERSFALGGGDYTAPAQGAPDFMDGRESGAVRRGSFLLGTRSARLDLLLPAAVRDALRHALVAFDRQLPGYASEEGVLIGVESRSSGAVRLPRDRQTWRAHGFANLLPIGEGAGWAGGIMSAALDGAGAAQALLRESE